MLIGEVDYPIQEGVLVIILVVSIIFTTFLFDRGNYSYTIKYQLMRKHQFFRENQIALFLVDLTYKVFFILPFLLIISLAILRGIKDTLEFLPILVNGMIVLLILYPSKRQYYYKKNAIMGILAVGSQSISLFLADDNSKRYAELSTMFYVINCIFLSLSILSIHNLYWDISKAIKVCGKMVQQVNEEWCMIPDPKIPMIFDGGIYGWFCKNRSFCLFAFLYLFSLSMLVIYAFFVWILQNSILGIVTALVAILFDFFILLLYLLGSSVWTLIIIAFSSRFFSFIFGANYWLAGYCLMYCIVGIYLGTLIIQKRLPAKVEIKPKKKIINLFNSPQCTLIFLTILIIIMIMIELYALNSRTEVGLQGVGIPLWQLAILLMVGTWVVILYLSSLRMLDRQNKKVRDQTKIYFGLPFITSYHACLVTIYGLIIGLGLYWYFYIQDITLLICAIFIPLLYLFGLNAFTGWVENDYQILIQINEYNLKMEKKYDLKVKKMNIIQKRKVNKHESTESVLKRTNKKIHSSKIKSNIDYELGLQSKLVLQSSQNMLSFKDKSKLIINKIEEKQEEYIRQQNNSGKKEANSIIPIHSRLFGILSQKYIQNSNDEQIIQIAEFNRVEDWRCNQNLSIIQIWGYLTPNDKRILISLGSFFILMIAFVVTNYLWSGSPVALQISLSILSYMSLLVFYRSIKCGLKFQILQLIFTALGLFLGLIFWAINYIQVQRNLSWSILFILLIIALIYQALGDKNNQIFMILLAIQIIILSAFILVILGVNFSSQIVIVAALLIILLAFGVINYYFFRTNGYMSFPLKIITAIIICIIVIGVTIGGLLLNFITNFTVFTVIMGILEITLFSLSVIMFIRKLNNQYDYPHVYSAYQYPIYRFQSDQQILKSSTKHKLIFSSSMIVLVIYSAVVSIIFLQKWMAVFTMGAFLVLNFIVLIMTSMGTYYSIALRQKQLTNQLIIDTFNLLKQKYMIGQTQGQDSPFFQAQLEKAKIEAQQLNTDQAWIKVVRLHDEVVKNRQEQQKFLFFWLVLIKFQLNTRKRAKKIEFISMIKQCQKQFIENGILIQSINQSFSPEIKFKILIKQINSLPPLQHVIYQQIVQIHRKEKKNIQRQLAALHYKEEISNNIRDDQLFQKLQKQGDSQTKIMQFKQLIKQLGRKGLFTDQQFPPNQTVLGELQGNVSSWRRPSIGQILVKDGISAGDVKQGQIGDCYLISSFAVLGQQRIKQALGLGVDGQLKWSNNKGAYMVRFFKFLKEVYVILDDQLPVNDQDQWVFAKSQDPIQFWPGILQKAYAKLYSGYDKIIEGKCHRVLAEFTGGFPFQIILDEYKNNPNGLWTKITNGKKNGYLLAAGSPSNPSGDSACSKRGIIQGHAYAILDSQLVQGHKLMKLKNPHGSAGREWIGDFSDKSELMTKRFITLLGHIQLEDGIFWMNLQDFIYQFKSLYVCAVFNDSWKRLQPIEGEWTMLNSYGTPNLSADTFKNPNYGIKTTKKCTIFINLTQQAVSALKGRNYIYMRVQRNSGQRIKRQDLSSQKLCGSPIRPINSVSISTQIELQADSYPYTFTLTVTCKSEGDTGKYTLQIYCSDQQAELIDDKQFDPLI